MVNDTEGARKWSWNQLADLPGEGMGKDNLQKERGGLMERREGRETRK